MAPKKALPPSPPPPHSEEEEETSEEEGSEEGEEEESDVEEDEKTTPIQPSPVNKKLFDQKHTTPPPPTAQSSQSEEEESESEEEDEEESDSPPSPNVSDFTVKPITPTKRPSDTQKDDEEELGNGKKMKTNEGEENIEKGSAVSTLVFSKPQDSKAFDVSKKLWGNADGEKDGKIGSINGNVKESKKDDLVMEDTSDNEGGFQSKYPILSQTFDEGSSSVPAHVISFVKQNLNLIDSVKVREWEEKWKQIHMQEAKIFLKKINLMTEQTELVLNARNKGRSGN